MHQNNNSSFPAPLTAANVDLRRLPGMMVDVQRMLNSDRHIECSVDANWAAFTLWCKAWHLVPAGSLPDDDAKLAAFAGYGRAIGEWLKIKDQALRGYQLCADGRLYHSFLSKVVNEAWESHQIHLHKMLMDRLTKAGRDTPRTKKEWVEAGCPNDWPQNSQRIPENSQRIRREIPLKEREGKLNEVKVSEESLSDGDSTATTTIKESLSQVDALDQEVYSKLKKSGWKGSQFQAHKIRKAFEHLSNDRLEEAIATCAAECDNWSKIGGTRYIIEHARRISAEDQNTQLTQLTQPPGRKEIQDPIAIEAERKAKEARQEESRKKIAEAFNTWPSQKIKELKTAFEDSLHSKHFKSADNFVDWQSKSSGLWGTVSGWLRIEDPNIYTEITGFEPSTSKPNLAIVKKENDDELNKKSSAWEVVNGAMNAARANFRGVA